MVSEFYSFDYYGYEVESGARVKFRNDRTVYRFRALYNDSVFNETWIEAVAPNGDIHEFHVSKFDGVHVAKRSRARYA